MAIAIILAIVFFAVIAGGAFFAWRNFGEENKILGIVGTVAAVAGLAGFILIPFSIHTVNTGEIAVVKHLGEAKSIRAAGTHFDFWITESYQKYDAKVQNIDIATAAYSSDAQTMDIQMTLQYQIMPDKVMDIVKQYGSLEMLQSRLQSIAIERAKAMLSSKKAMDIIQDRAAMSPSVEQSIRTAIDESYFVNVTAVVLTNIDFSDAFELAVEEKMIAEQNKLKAEYENETKIALAEADAKAKLVEAEAAAQAKLVEAEAEQKANDMLEQSITSKILQKTYLDKWDGKLPSVMGDGNLDIMIPVQAESDQRSYSAAPQPAQAPEGGE